MRRWVGLMLSMLTWQASAATPSECAQAAPKSQQLICQHAPLREYQRQVQAVWLFIQPQLQVDASRLQVRQAQQQQWQLLLDSCNNTACLTQRFKQRLIDLVSLQRSGISFMDFPARLYDGQLADPLPDSHGPILPPEQLPAGLSQDQVNDVLIDGEPQLAGEYAVLQAGCGPSCQMQFVLNLRTGQMLAEHFGGPCQRQLLAYQPDSQLLIAQQPAQGNQPSQWLYFQLHNNQLTLLHALALPDHQAAAQGCA